MTSRTLLLLTSLVAAVTYCRADFVDATREAGTFGPDVVKAVVDVMKAKCIFSEDKQFLRRLAFVESRDGADTSTYANGYNGGIWKVSQAMLQATTPCPAVLRPTCDIIRDELRINWDNVTWTDLRKPLYSGLAAALYMLQRLNNSMDDIPPTLAGQGDTWSHYYHLGTPTRNFTSMASLVAEYECSDEMDLVFILDSSGSINDGDFVLSRDFVANVVQGLDVPKVVQVSVVIFEDLSTIQFSFNSHNTKTAVISAINSIQRTKGGTQTDKALDITRTQVFTTASGARLKGSVKRVAVLVTDGASNDKLLTTLAARRLREEAGVTVFSIGVGSYNLVELKSVASDPKCSHVFTLKHFSAIDSIRAEIQRSTCEASRTLSQNTTVVGNSTTTIGTPPTNGTAVVTVNCGIADVYVSYTNPNPNPALYAEKFQATEGHPAYLLSTSTNAQGKPFYITVIGSKLPENSEGLQNCTDFKYEVAVKPINWEIKCCHDGVCSLCTDEQLRLYPGLKDLICNNGPSYFPNPCTPDHLNVGLVIFPYPYDQSKFIKCDYRGDAYVTECPNSQTYNPATRTCGYDTPGSTTLIPLPDNVDNPCTPAHIQAQYLYFTYEPDHRMFIHCDLWGHAWLERCPELEVWSEKLLTCVEDKPGPGVTTPAPHKPTNPCTPAALAAGLYFHPYPCDHTRYIHCDISGNAYTQFCPGGLFFDPTTNICLTQDTQQGNHGCD